MTCRRRFFLSEVHRLHLGTRDSQKCKVLQNGFLTFLTWRKVVFTRPALVRTASNEHVSRRMTRRTPRELCQKGLVIGSNRLLIEAEIDAAFGMMAIWIVQGIGFYQQTTAPARHMR
ncbi:hypothetical protein OI25_7689 [Paraburkholderia fungorum]|uniref:Uncharacterized protein n=1 Tax=Paraburkholderia fungorum TaxID=134537 RepID=A0AAU8T8W8_9BURK|nr:hypothetical protein OI25_7689 [Paraburkholderia fungorum]PRZ41268.1 hypothetical protein BX589_1721 [Paraburkholderia fungorum]